MIIVWACPSRQTPPPGPLHIPAGFNMPAPPWERGRLARLCAGWKPGGNVEPASRRQCGAGIPAAISAAGCRRHNATYGPFRLAQPLPPAPSPKGEGVTSISKSKSGSKSGNRNRISWISAMIIVLACPSRQTPSPRPSSYPCRVQHAGPPGSAGVSPACVRAGNVEPASRRQFRRQDAAATTPYLGISPFTLQTSPGPRSG